MSKQPAPSVAARVLDSRAPLWLFYDAQCGMCTRSVAWALARDTRDLLRPFPSLSREATDKLGLADPRPLGQLQAWSGSRGVVRGIDAVAAMLTRLPGWGPASAALRFPLVLPFARMGYAMVAANRHRFGAPISCGVPERGAETARPPRHP